MAMVTVPRLVILVVLLWLLLFLVYNLPGFKPGNGANDETGPPIDNQEMILARLSRASSELKWLKKQNEDLRTLLNQLVPLKGSPMGHNPFVSDGLSDTGDSCTPSVSFESTRRRLTYDLNELWFYLRTKVNRSMIGFINEHRHNMLHNLGVIAERDAKWRYSAMKQMEKDVQGVISDLQNPKNCDSAKKLVCTLNKGCGFGCQIHHVAYCFTVALATGRTLILDSHGWRYMNPKNRKAKDSGWSLIFKPLSESCTEAESGPRSPWKGGSESIQVVELPIIDSLRPRPPYLPLAVPEEISLRLDHLHDNPPAWFMGQIVKYIMRMSPEMDQFINDAKYRFQFRRPIVGFHVRRTDKVGSEAAFHALSEYMAFAQDYFHQLQLFSEKNQTASKQPIDKLIYLATDDPGIWRKEVQKYEDEGFTFLGDSDIAQSAGVGTRYSLDSLRNVILDIVLLSQCDILVCTFSSQVCRLSYELMQTRNEINRQDWSGQYYSLDDIYYFGGQSDHNQMAILPHTGNSDNKEISFKSGDIIGVAGNHWNGYSKGINRRSQESGLYPGFKVTEMVSTAPFKAFSERLKGP